MKPVYEIENAFISSGRLWGNIKDHPNCPNGNLQMTSLILHRDTPDVGLDGNCVETENSIYRVRSWDTDYTERITNPKHLVVLR